MTPHTFPGRHQLHPDIVQAVQQLVVLKPGVAQLERFQLLGKLPIPGGRVHLTLQVAHLTFHFRDDIPQPHHVLVRRFQPARGQFLAVFVFDNSGGLFEQEPAVFGPRADDHIHLSLADQGIGVGADSGIHEQFLDIPKAGRHLVEQVLSFAVPVHPPADLHFRVFHRQLQVGIIKAQHHFGHPHGGAVGSPVEYHILHAAAAQGFGALFAQRPAQRVQNVTFSRAVRAHNARDARAQFEHGSVGEGFKPMQDDPLEIHAGIPQTATARSVRRFQR